MLFGFSPRRWAGRGPGGVAARPSPTRLERWTELVARHRAATVAVWLAVASGGVAASLTLPSHLVNSFAVPGTDSAQAQAVLERGFGERPEGTFTVVFEVDDPYDRGRQASLRERLAAAAHDLPGGHVGAFRAGPGVVYADVETPLDLQRAKEETDTLRRALARSAGPPALVTGQPAIQHDLDPVLADDLRRGQALAVPLALLALTLLLGVSWALVFPFLCAAGTMAGSLLVLAAVARLHPTTPYAVNLVELIGLGLAVDYALLAVCRYREELGRGAPDAALVRTMVTSGRTVVMSGLVVAVGLALLLLVPVPFIRGIGLAGLIVPLVAVATALTLQPALLSLLGRRALPRRGAHGRSRGVDLWGALARQVMRHPLAVLVPTTAILLVAALPARDLATGPGSFSSLPAGTEATQGLFAQRDAFGPGALTPIEVAVDTGRREGARSGAVRQAVDRLADALFRDPEVFVVASGRRAPYTSTDGRYTRVRVVARHEYGADASRRFVGRLREALVPAARFPQRVTVAVGGAPAQGVDFLARAYAYVPWLVAAAFLLTYLLLAWAFRSLLLPLKALVLNVLSVAAAYGLLVAVFQKGVATSLLGVEQTPQIDGWVPLFLLATLFGLSMDYEVFLVSRMREAWERGRDNAAAVAEGLAATGRLITVAALVMAITFAAFVVGTVPGLQQFGLGLAFAVLIDALLIRSFLVPALMALAGRWNWWLPQRGGGARRRLLLLVASAVAVSAAAPSAAAVAPRAVDLTIRHVVAHCHVWQRAGKRLGATVRITVRRGTTLRLRADCPMDFDLTQLRGPRLPLGDRRVYAGTARTVRFERPGVYRLRATNVQTPEERGLETLGDANTLVLTVAVR